ncbi:MAG: cupin domain-containing protein [Actinomycetota bacterium]|nr:cupin domain-containing protein [Actinomycetota bacterium]
MDVPALERCVGDVDAFFDKHWGLAPLLREPDGDASFDDLSSADDLDRMVSSLGLRASNLRMVKDGKTLPPAAYTTSARGQGSEDVVNAALVYQRYAEGGTIVLESLHRYWEPLTDFCRDLELALGHRLQVNAYITPRGSRGFDVHRDDHDVFVLQVSGSKHWIVYDRDDEDIVLIDQDIERGACLYIPTGFPHAATTARSSSSHLTVGILTHDGIDVVREIVKLAEQEPIFKERLRHGSAQDVPSLRETLEKQVDEMRAWLDKLDVDELTERVARRVMATSQGIVRGQLHQLDELDAIGPTTVVARRRGAVCVVFPGDGDVKVLLADRQLEMPPVARAAMEEVARRERFAVRDLQSFLDAEGAVILVKRLVREGLLEVVLDG